MSNELRNQFRSTRRLVSTSDHTFTSGEQLALLHRSAVAGQRSVEFVDGDRSFVDFSRCSYTGLGNDPRLLEGAHRSLNEMGSLHWPVARTRLEPRPLRELEERLSAVFGARVITYSSVSLASASVLPVLASGVLFGDTPPLVLVDERAHASLQALKPTLADETEVRTVRHEDWDSIEQQCQERQTLYVCDGVWSMGGGVDIGHLRGLQERWGLALYVDDAHGVSIRGGRGEGYARTLLGSKPAATTFVVTSLSKGFGASGAALLVFGEREEQLLRRFSLASAFSHPLNAAALGAALASAEIHLSDELRGVQARLQQRIRAFDQRISTRWRGDGLPIRRIDTTSIEMSLSVASALLAAGLFVSPVFFPTVPKKEPGLRVCLSAAHDAPDIDKLADGLLACGIPPGAEWHNAPVLPTEGPLPNARLIRSAGTWDIFDWSQAQQAEARLISTASLVSEKNELANSDGGVKPKRDPRITAADRIGQATLGNIARRKPFVATKLESGQYRLIDGNATFQALTLCEWSGEVPTVVANA